MIWLYLLFCKYSMGDGWDGTEKLGYISGEKKLLVYMTWNATPTKSLVRFDTQIYKLENTCWLCAP